MKVNKIGITAKDGAYISAVAYGFEASPVKGIVILSHGFGEHAGSYDELIDRLARAHYACVIFDQRGHGALSEPSPAKRKKLCGIIPSYQCFLDDMGAVAAAMRQKAPDTPIALYGHSMGGNIIVNFLLKSGQSDVSCAVLESPWLGLHKEVNPLVAGVAKVVGRITPNVAIVNKLTLRDVTGDKAKAEEIKNDPLYHNRISLRLFSGIKSACAYAMNNATRLFIPIYLAFAKHDKIVSNQAILKCYRAAGPNVMIKGYESQHAVHNDVKRDVFMRDMIAFLDARCHAAGGRESLR